MDLDNFFKPKSIVVIGASRNPKKFGHVIFENLLSTFPGRVYPINPNADKILGEKCYPSINAIPGKVDLAIIVIPSELVLSAVKACSKKKVKACIILSAGFGEIGNVEAEKQILKEKGKMRIIGPNVIGIYDSHSGVDAIFNPKHRQERPAKGRISFISQSGAFGAAILDMAATEGVGIAKFASIGNRIDIDEVDLLNYLERDSETDAIALYIEGSKRGKEFFKTLRKTTKKKPVVAIKAGRTQEGAKAVLSHTGSLAGEVEIYSAMFKQAGVIEARSIEDLFDFTKAFLQPLPRGDRVAVITNGGGFGIIATDVIIENNLKLAKLGKKTIGNIKKKVPHYCTIANPMDLVGDANTERYEVALKNVMADKNVDGIIVTTLLQIPALESGIVDVLMNLKKKKPLLVCMPGGEFTETHRKMLEKAGIPTYPTPERAAKSMKILVDYAKIRKKSIVKF